MYVENRIKLITRWIIFTFLGGMIGFWLGSATGEQYGSLLGHNIENTLSNVFPSGYLPSMVAGLFYGGVIGAFIGLFQWVTTLRYCYKDSDNWIFLHVIGYALAICLNSGVSAYLVYNVKIESSLGHYMFDAFTNGPIIGLVVGFLEWRFYSSKSVKAIWWLILNIIGWILLGVIGTMGRMLLEIERIFWLEMVFNIIINLGITTFTSIAFNITLPSALAEGSASQ